MTFDETLAAVRRFRDARDWEQFHRPKNLAAAVAKEAHELLELYLWTDDADVGTARRELADVMIQCLNLADALGVDPLEIVSEKLAINERNYPVELSRGSSAKQPGKQLYCEVEGYNGDCCYCPEPCAASEEEL